MTEGLYGAKKEKRSETKKKKDIQVVIPTRRETLSTSTLQTERHL